MVNGCSSPPCIIYTSNYKYIYICIYKYIYIYNRIDPLISKLQQQSRGINNQQIPTIIKPGQTFREIGEKVTEMTNSHNDLFVVRRCSQVQKQRSGRSLLRRHGIETTIPDDRKMRKHDENDEHDSFLFTGLVFISLLQPPLVSTETPLRVAWVAVAFRRRVFRRSCWSPASRYWMSSSF